MQIYEPIHNYNDFQQRIQQRKQFLSKTDGMREHIIIRKNREPYLAVLPTLWGCIIYQGYKEKPINELWLTHEEIRQIYKATQ